MITLLLSLIKENKAREIDVRAKDKYVDEVTAHICCLKFSLKNHPN